MTRPTILLAIDLSATVPEVRPVVDLAVASGWSIHLLHVVPQQIDGAPLQTELDELAAQIAALGVSGVQATVVGGPTVDFIIGTAEALDAAMIAIVGARHTITHRVMLGSVAASLLKVSPRPVIVLPTPDADIDAGLSAALDRLIDLIDRDEPSDELIDLRQAAEDQLSQPETEEDPEIVRGRLREVLERFETDHPSLTRAINDLSYYLSGMGI